MYNSNALETLTFPIMNNWVDVAEQEGRVDQEALRQAEQVEGDAGGCPGQPSEPCPQVQCSSGWSRSRGSDSSWQLCTWSVILISSVSSSQTTLWSVKTADDHSYLHDLLSLIMLMFSFYWGSTVLIHMIYVDLHGYRAVIRELTNPFRGFTFCQILCDCSMILKVHSSGWQSWYRSWSFSSWL